MNILPPGLRGFVLADEMNQRRDANAVQQAVGIARLQGMLQELAQNDEAKRREAQMRADIEALGPNPDPRMVAQVAAKYATPQQLLAHHSKVAAEAPQRQAQNELAAYLTGYQGNQESGPVAPPMTTAPTDDAALAKFGYRMGPGGLERIPGTQDIGEQPLSVNVQNPSKVQALAAKAYPQAIPKVLDQLKPPTPGQNITAVTGGYLQHNPDGTSTFVKTQENQPRNEPAPTFHLVEDRSSPTGWSHQNTRTGERVPGAPAPASATRAPRVMPAPLQKQLTEAGELVDATERFSTSFKDEYGGKTITGSLGNTVGKIIGDPTGQTQWWQDYELHQSQIRNKLFGSALTAAEIEAWNKSAISPRMDPAEIRKNLARREAIERRGLNKLTTFAERSGFAKDQIEGLIGRPIGQQPVTQPTPAAPGGWSIRPVQ